MDRIKKYQGLKRNYLGGLSIIKSMYAQIEGANAGKLSKRAKTMQQDLEAVLKEMQTVLPKHMHTLEFYQGGYISTGYADFVKQGGKAYQECQQGITKSDEVLRTGAGELMQAKAALAKAYYQSAIRLMEHEEKRGLE